MRMWMVSPKLLCRQHLLGEHGEIHKHRHNFIKKHNMAGRIGHIDPEQQESRHNELAKEMQRRGYNHKSPYKQPDVSYLPRMKVDKNVSLKELCSRCFNCRERILKYHPEFTNFIVGDKL